RIDEEIARRAIEPFAAGNQQLFGSDGHEDKLGRRSAKRKGLRFLAHGSIGSLPLALPVHL
ncbi:MAG: hypothetical protein Q8O63_03885, partial [Hoeflea sp.]|nr:hypothetical protein [Hoeflea sp.]